MLSPRRRWLIAFTVAVLVSASVFLYVNRDGCWLFWGGYLSVVPFVLLGIWIALFVALGMTGRLIMVAIAALASVLTPQVFVIPGAAARARAIGTLREFREILSDADRNKHYPDTLPARRNIRLDQRFYSFHYVPLRSDDGNVKAFLLSATPSARSRFCRCAGSFALTTDGRIHFTLEDRQALASDDVLLEQ